MLKTVRMLAILSCALLTTTARAADAPADAQKAAGGGLHAGMVLDQSNWQLADGLLPPEILDHYKTGGYANPIVDWPLGTFNWPPDFKAATEKNAGQFKISDQGTVVLNSTGEQPPYILGFPFPIIDAKDPQAATKILWNYFYLTWYYGNLRAQSQVNWVQPHAMERRTDQDVRFKRYDGVPEHDRGPNPDNFNSQFLTVADTPADLAGTAALSWRYRDPTKRDSAWAFVPALRRVRAVSPANRSDGFLGSDMSQDDGPFFDGKPEDFTWTLKGETEVLRIVDPLNLQGIPLRVDAGRGLAPRMGRGPQNHRLSGSGLEGPGLGAAQRRARQTPHVDHRRRPEGPLLPVRQDRAVHRQGDLPGILEPEIQLAG